MTAKNTTPYNKPRRDRKSTPRTEKITPRQKKPRREQKTTS
jgi:hypothetical protein